MYGLATSVSVFGAQFETDRISSVTEILFVRFWRSQLAQWVVNSSVQYLL
jgi:hypothetical protein